MLQINIKMSKKKIDQLALFNGNNMESDQRLIIGMIYKFAYNYNVQPVEVCKAVSLLINKEESNVFPITLNK